jgi:hypothetical protein
LGFYEFEKQMFEEAKWGILAVVGLNVSDMYGHSSFWYIGYSITQIGRMKEGSNENFKTRIVVMTFDSNERRRTRGRGQTILQTSKGRHSYSTWNRIFRLTAPICLEKFVTFRCKKNLI